MPDQLSPEVRNGDVGGGSKSGGAVVVVDDCIIQGQLRLPFSAGSGERGAGWSRLPLRWAKRRGFPVRKKVDKY